jgi:hypothetical protein
VETSRRKINGRSAAGRCVINDPAAEGKKVRKWIRDSINDTLNQITQDVNSPE